MNEKYEVNWL